MRYRVGAFLLAVSTLLVWSPEPVAAYFGPGGVASGVGAVVALGAAMVASVFGFVWFPVKRLLARTKANEAEGTTE